MKARVRKWGRSLTVRIPAAHGASGVAEGMLVDVTTSRGRIVIRPEMPLYRLEDLVRRITPENRHGETDWGAPVGKEDW